MKAEISSLEYAVCALMCKLEMLLTDRYGHRTLNVGGGFAISTPKHLSVGQDAFVTIHPAGWPDGSDVHARFYRGSGEWELYEGGEIYAPHAALRARVHFKPTEDGLEVRLDPTADDDRGMAYTGYSQLIEALERDIEKIPMGGWGA